MTSSLDESHNPIAEFAEQMEAGARWIRQHRGKPRTVKADEIDLINDNLAINYPTGVVAND